MQCRVAWGGMRLSTKAQHSTLHRPRVLSHSACPVPTIASPSGEHTRPPAFLMSAKPMHAYSSVNKPSA